MKKFVGFLLILALVMSLGASAFAVEGDTFTYTGTDATTNGKIEVTNATEGRDYTLYKIFDATYSQDDSNIVSYTIKAGDLKDYLVNNGSDYFTVGTTPDANGNYSVTRAGSVDQTTNEFVPTKTDAELIAFLETDAMKALYTEIGEITSTVNGKITFDKIPYGYYFITSSLGSVVSIDTNNPAVEIIDKNQTYEFDKNIIEPGENNTENKVKVNDAMLNEDVLFEIKVNATNYNLDKKIVKYAIYDFLDLGMTYTADSLSVVVTDADGNNPVTVTDYTINYYANAAALDHIYDATNPSSPVSSLAAAQAFELLINWTADGTKNTDFLYDSNAIITVRYKAFLDPTKEEQIVFGGTIDANTNSARVRHFEESDTTPKGELPDKKTDTFVTELTILKKDDKGNALKGAEFTLTGPTGLVIITVRDVFTENNTSGTYYLLNNGTYTTEAPTGDTEHDSAYKYTDKTYSKTTETVTTGAGQTQTAMKATVGDDGKVTFEGLVAGKYTLTESIVPEGFNKIDDIEFNVSFTATQTTNTASNTGYEGKFATDTNKITVEADNTLTMTVVNMPGTELPSTGGIGTTIFYIIGGILVVGAGVVLVARKKTKDD